MMLAQGDVAGVLVSTPNRFGMLEDYTGLADGATFRQGTSCHVCQSVGSFRNQDSGRMGRRHCVWRCSAARHAVELWWPYLGFLCYKKAHIRKLPGRIVSARLSTATVSVCLAHSSGSPNSIYVAKATKQYMFNQGLMALFAAYISRLQ